MVLGRAGFRLAWRELVLNRVREELPPYARASVIDELAVNAIAAGAAVALRLPGRGKTFYLGRDHQLPPHGSARFTYAG